MNAQGLRVEVVSYHGKTCLEVRTTFVGLKSLDIWLTRHYNRSPYNHTKISGRLCFTMDQADKVLYEIKRKNT